MNIDRIKKIVKNHLFVSHDFLYKGSRNYTEEFHGTISKMYPAIFIIELDNGEVRSFSYNDFIVGNLQIIK